MHRWLLPLSAHHGASCSFAVSRHLHAGSTAWVAANPSTSVYSSLLANRALVGLLACKALLAEQGSALTELAHAGKLTKSGVSRLKVR